MEFSELACQKRMEIPSRPENITMVEKMIDEICETHHIEEDLYGNILIALTEAVNNAIQHGNRKDPEKNVKVGFTPNEDVGRFSFFVGDQGPGFDFEDLPDPTDPRNVEKPFGRGVFLMKNLADEVNFYDNGATVEITFKVNPN